MKSLTEHAALVEVIHRRCQQIIDDLDRVERLIEARAIPRLLVPYRRMILQAVSQARAAARQSLVDLQASGDLILVDLLSETARLLSAARSISRRMADPLLRSTREAAPCLWLIGWMHDSNELTRCYPAAFLDGAPSVLPFTNLTPLYGFPAVEQHGLLMLPLLLHEYGHVLQLLHLTEMNDLIADLQRAIGNSLQPSSSRNDEMAQAMADRRKRIVDRWYVWAVELFCDAVGLVMGGASYLHAFANYCGTLRQSDYGAAPTVTEVSQHPFVDLRIRLLINRAEKLGLHYDAGLVRTEWDAMAERLEAGKVDSLGYFEPAWLGSIEATIDDMLVEAGPRAFTAEEATAEREWQPGDSPILLCNRAWRIKADSPQFFAEWERKTVAAVLAHTEAT
jgi:hypothetical protein